MLDHKAIERCYEVAEFWGAPMWAASKYVEKHIEDFEIKPQEIILKIRVLRER